MATRGARWDPFREIAQLQNELSRLVGSAGEREGPALIPPADVWETEDQLGFAFDVPGVAEDDVSIELEDNTLTVTAERKPSENVPDERYHRRERRYGTYSRTISVPPGTSEGDVSARYDRGVLEITVRKPEEPKPKRIQIGVQKPGA
ncbi:MAG: Hsp20/alpha crystallin family protein [Actinomycetota bacterium]|nr:Hsp20/alpha crystallin family protein [Actinomycetota bacterium]